MAPTVADPRGPAAPLPGINNRVEISALAGPNLQVGIIAYGARIAYVRAPDRTGSFADVSLGYDDEDGWRADRDYLGATIGRFANRIAGGRFELDGREYLVPANEGANALHGGPAGFDVQEFAVSEVYSGEHGGQAVTARRTSPDGEMGFPGALDVSVTFTVAGTDLILDFLATTDAPTVVNLTNHAYWNLSGRPGSIEGHRIRLASSTYLPVDADLLPVGGPAPVAGTPLDFRESTAVGDRWHRYSAQTALTHGIDHTYLLDDEPDGGEPNLPRFAARVEEPGSGRTLELYTDQPGVQFYTGNFLDGTAALRGGSTARSGAAFCLEPQRFPDTPNRPEFPSAVLRPGEEYRHRSVFRFGVTG